MLSRTLIILALSATVTGCANSSMFSPYPEQSAALVTSYQSGNTSGLMSRLERRATGRDALLYRLEQGRLAQLAGEYDTSTSAFNAAFGFYDALDDRATLSATGLAGTTTSFLTNDNARPYASADYERIFAHTYQALNYLAKRDPEGAGIEVRRANLEQVAAAERRQKEIAKAQQEASENNVDLSLSEGGMGGLDLAAGGVKSSFQNAYTFYLSAVFWEASRDYNAAWIDYKKAFEINQDAGFLKEDINRMGRMLGERVKATLPGEQEGLLVVIHEQGQVPRKREFSLPVPTIHGFLSIALPTYEAHDIEPAQPVRVLDAQGNTLIQSEEIAQVAAMAARSLKEDMPGLMVRQTLRAVSKYAVQKEANNQNPLLGFATNIYNLVSERADLRSWSTLPAHVHAGRAIVPAGEHQLTFQSHAGMHLSEPVRIEPRRITLVRVIGFAGTSKVEVHYL